MADNGTDVALTACPDGSWCADNVPGSQGCCTAGNGFVITQDGTVTQHDGSAVSVSLPSFSSSATQISSISSLSTTFSSPTASTLPPTPNPRPSGLSLGAKAGIGIAVALGVITALTVVYFLYRARRTARLQEEGKSHEMYQPPPPTEMEAAPMYPELGPSKDGSQKSSGGRYSLGATNEPAQLE